MLSWFRKDPLRALEDRYARLLVEARDLQRGGDVVASSAKTAEAEAVLQRIEEIETAGR